MNIEELANYMIDHIKRSKFQFLYIDDVSKILRNKLKDKYDSQIGIQVKSLLRDHDDIDFFIEDDYFHDHKAHYSVGNWLASRGVYKTPLDAKFKMNWYSWQTTEDRDDEYL